VASFEQEKSYADLYSGSKHSITSRLVQVKSVEDIDKFEVDASFFDAPAKDIPALEYVARDLERSGKGLKSLREFVSFAFSKSRFVWVSLVGSKVVGVLGCAEDPQRWAGVSEKGVQYKGFTGFFLVKLVKGISRGLVDDVFSALDFLLGLHDYVSWKAESDNPAISDYRKVVQKYGGVEVVRGGESFFCRSNIPAIIEAFKVGVSEQNIQASYGQMGLSWEGTAINAFSGFDGGRGFHKRQTSSGSNMQTITSNAILDTEILEASTSYQQISSEVLVTPKFKDTTPVFKNILYNKGVFCVLVNEWQYPDVQGIPSGYDAYGRGGWDKRSNSLWLDGGMNGSSSGHPAFVYDNFYWAVNYQKQFTFQGKSYPGVIYISGKNIESEAHVQKEVVSILKGIYGKLPANGTDGFKKFRKAMAGSINSSGLVSWNGEVLIDSANNSNLHGYWISPSNKWYDLGGDFHFTYLLDHLELFGFSDEGLPRKLSGSELQVDEDAAMLKAFQRGWVQLRLVSQCYVSLFDLGNSIDRLSDIAFELLDKGYARSYYLYVSFWNKAGYQYKYTLQELTENQDKITASFIPSGSVIWNGRVRAGVIVHDINTGFILGGHPTGEPAGIYDLPKGQMDDGEDPLTAAVRELREETGIDVDPSELKYCGEFPLRNSTMHTYLLSMPVDVGSIHCDSLIDNPNTPERIGLPEMDSFALLGPGQPGKWFGAVWGVIKAAMGWGRRVQSRYSAPSQIDFNGLVSKAVSELREDISDFDNVGVLNSVFAGSGIHFEYEHGDDYKFPSVAVRYGYLTDRGNVCVVLGEGFVEDWADPYKKSEVVTALKSIWTHEDTHKQQGVAEHGVVDDPSVEGYGSSPQAVDAMARQSASELLDLYSAGDILQKLKGGNEILKESSTGWEFYSNFGNSGDPRDLKIWKRFIKRFYEFVMDSGSINSSAPLFSAVSDKSFEGWFISPEGKIITLQPSTSHNSYIKTHLDLFPWVDEDDSDKVLSVLKHGWIRISYFGMSNIIISLFNGSGFEQKLKNWAFDMLSDGFPESALLSVTDLSDGIDFKITLAMLAYNESVGSSAQKSYTDLYSGSGGVITSALVPATKERLEAIEQTDPALWKRLHVPVENNPALFKQYQFVNNSGSLFDFILRLLKIEAGEDGASGFHVCFSVDGDAGHLLGVLTYTLNNEKESLSNIKVFSFKDDSGKDNNEVITRDAIKLIERSLPSYNVSWMCDINHPNRGEYDRFIERYGLEAQGDPDNSNILLYFIGKGSLPQDMGERVKVHPSSLSESTKHQSGSSEGVSSSFGVQMYGYGTKIRGNSSKISESVGVGKERESQILSGKQGVGSVGGVSFSSIVSPSVVVSPSVSIGMVSSECYEQGTSDFQSTGSQDQLITNNAELIESATAQELIDGNNNPNFYHRAQHLAATKAQGDSEIMRAFANTLELRTKSEHFDSNQTYYRQWVLFKDFKSIAKDKKIKIEDAVDYSLNFGDVTVRCNCRSQVYHGFSYMGTQLGYLYGLPREGRFPKRNNPDLQNTTCKHVHMALQHILSNKEKIIKMFAQYYKRLVETPEDTMIAIPAEGAEEEKEVKEGNFDDAFKEELPEDQKQEPEPEVISKQEEGTDTVYIDTKMAEGELPPERQVKYAGDENKGESDVAENVADSVSEDEVDDLEDEIEMADTGPRSNDERYVNEWSFQRFKRQMDYTPLLCAETCVITSVKEPLVKPPVYKDTGGVIIGKLKPVAFTWFKAMSEKLLQRFPGGSFNYVQKDFAWKVCDKDGELLLSLAMRESDGVFMYLYYDKNRVPFSGFVKRMSSLSELIDKVGV